MLKKLPAVFYNRTSVFGMIVFAIALSMIVFLVILDSFAPVRSPYLGLITFIALPMIMLFGLFVAIIGLIRAARRKRRGEEERKLPIIDLNQKRHFNAFNMFMVGGLFLMFVSAFGSYHAYEYTESVEFCGKVCHNVMKPEFVAYHESAHARVSCVECHIGGGADWYVKSKISGAYQVYSVLFDKYSRPIETPIANLRPARETCEKCHWPDHFYSQKLVDRNYFLQDETNSQAQISMLMKIGGTSHGQSEGIHAHMYLDAEISYIATDRQRQDIAWVEVKHKDGRTETYRHPDHQLTDDLFKKSEKRIVDCIDCHNRPAHQYQHPEFSVNTAMSRGGIDPKIPEIKLMAVQVLGETYKTETEALGKIKAEIEKYYAENHPDVAKSMAPQLQKAIQSIQNIYSKNFFPEMKTSWVSFPNNLDHMHSKGCFRCHDGKMKSDKGKVISNDCQSCHTILSQMGPDGKRQTDLKGLQFKHPMEIGDEWKTTPCKDCHGQTPDE